MDSAYYLKKPKQMKTTNLLPQQIWSFNGFHTEQSQITILSLCILH